MRLLLDEMFSAVIAEQLRARGHDVVGVTERPDLRGEPDPSLFAAAQGEGRALVTDNVSDYLPLDAEYRARGEAHAGLILTHNKRFPRGRPRTTGKLVEALHVSLEKPPSPGDFVHWL